MSRTGHELGPTQSPLDIVLPEHVSWEDGLSEEEAIVVGLWNSSAYRELLADLEITQAEVIRAAQLQNPSFATMFPVGPKQWEFALKLPMDVLWLRPIRVAAAQMESARVAQRLSQDGLDVVRDIRLAYFDWQLAVRKAELARQGLELRSDISRIAEARLDAGELSELDVSTMRMDVLFSQSEVSRTESDASVAMERLRLMMGIQLTERTPLAPRPAEMANPLPGDLDVEQLVGSAVTSRPDLRALQLALAASEFRTELAQCETWQTSLILPDINSLGRKGFEAGPGLELTLPLFHQNQGAIARSLAETEQLSNRFAKQRDTAAFEVREAHAQLVQALIEQEMWRDRIIPEAEATVASARRALEEDGVSLLTVLETTRQLLAAQQREADATAQVHRAISNLERSVGRRLCSEVSVEPLENDPLPPPGREAVENS